MAKLDEELVAAFIVEKFKVTQSEAWEFVDEVKAQAKADAEAEAAEKGERKKKQYIVAVSDPENKYENVLKDLTGYIIEKLPTADGEWGDLELSKKIDDCISEIKTKYSKKGPFECLDDLLNYVPGKYWKEKGIKLLNKKEQISALIPVTLKNLKEEVVSKTGFLH